MIQLRANHLKTGEELSSDEIHGLIQLGIQFKNERKTNSGLASSLLQGKHLALLFDKPSLRTRFSFTIAMSELGGNTIESVSNTRKHEEPEDLARVLSGYCHGIVVRTHSDQIIEKMASSSRIPVINGLSEFHHPCQILADLMTLKEKFGNLKNLSLAYIGDGNNILNSLLLLSPLVGLNVRYSCPKEYQPSQFIIERSKILAREYKTEVSSWDSPENAVRETNAVYTDVWTSMGFEDEKTKRNNAFEGFQVNERLLSFASKGAVVLHCLPMERGKEISETLPDSPSSAIFQQSENRLHIQKAILAGLMKKRN